MILVTGANGTVGREVARRLEGHVPARLGVRDPYDGNEACGRVRFDFLDPSSFDAALNNVQRVFLLRPPHLARARHDFGPFIKAMQRAGVAHVVFLSVRGAERNRLLPHRRIERLLERSGLAWTHLRPNDFMQNFAIVHQADIRDRGELWAPAGRGRTSFVDARDVAKAAVRVLTEAGHECCAYTLTGGAALGLAEVAAMLSDARGQPVTYRDPGVLAFVRHVHASGRPLALGFVMVGVYTAARLGWAAAVSPDLERLIGRPPTPMRAFIDDYAAAWRLPSPEPAH